MRRSPNNYPGYPRGRLSVVKHRQLACQVGACGPIAIKSSTDFDNMIFPMGSIFIFGSWICKEDSEGNLQGRLAQKAHEEITLPTGSAEDLAERFSGLTMSGSTQAPTTTSLDLVAGSNSSSGSNPGSFRDKPGSFPIGLRNAASTLQEINLNLLQVSSRKLSRLPTGLNNVARAYQDLLQKAAGPVRRLRLTRAQEGLVLTVTSKDCLVHWLGTFPQNSNTRLIEEAITLPYQEGGALRDANAPTEVISNYSRAGEGSRWWTRGGDE
jgi:hypothetical protein